jgi:hypothetical protein
MDYEAVKVATLGILLKTVAPLQPIHDQSLPIH